MSSLLVSRYLVKYEKSCVVVYADGRDERALRRPHGRPGPRMAPPARPPAARLP